ncbi:MAG: radical SAM family heme chaperone HemW [Oscillospiraceae bacterium]|nr:radical SAM family heme chaperone HemW [Oscillospiraceae bacterium]
MRNLGLYIHIPFCTGKCPYCDFYSINADEKLMDRYLDALLRDIRGQDKYAIDSIYFGGGSPSIFGAGRIAEALENIYKQFKVIEPCEITVECRPMEGLDYSYWAGFFKTLSKAGANRLSLGLQSVNGTELKILNRRADAENVMDTVEAAKSCVIQNISLDLMLGIPGQTIRSLGKSIDFCLDSDVTHISAYMLKIEDGTPFAEMELDLPCEEEVCDLYLHLAARLEKAGIYQYEISNFAKKGFESRHNLKYWRCEEYLGFGAAAHFFINGERYCYPRDISYYIEGKPGIFDSAGGDFGEYAMLKLRLAEGLNENEVMERFSHNIPKEMHEKAGKFQNMGLAVCDKNGIRLTRKGFLLSNTVISEIIL